MCFKCLDKHVNMFFKYLEHGHEFHRIVPKLVTNFLNSYFSLSLFYTGEFVLSIRKHALK